MKTKPRLLSAEAERGQLVTKKAMAKKANSLANMFKLVPLEYLLGQKNFADLREALTASDFL
jgi:hypothetical protein